LTDIIARAIRMHGTDQLNIAVAAAIVVAAADTGFGTLRRTAYRLVNLVVDADRFHNTSCLLDGSTNFPKIRAGKIWELCPDAQLSGQAI
jgi:hypothetical protein